MTPPVLFLIFNRPDLTARTFDQIRRAKPCKLFVAADGPRDGRSGESELCAECREIVRVVDWECEVHTLFRKDNIGCKNAVREAITWFFEHVEEGIILEDDCLPSDGFFHFSDDLLELYRDDTRVMAIAGSNFQDGIRRGEGSYYFSIYPYIWGWATWRRAWRCYDANLDHWPTLRETSFLEGFFSEEESAYWKGIFDSTRNGEIDTWDYQWFLSCWQNSGLTATPNVNLITNIGCDARATHTTSPSERNAFLGTGEIPVVLKHPALICRDSAADDYVSKTTFKISRPPAQQKKRLLHNSVRFAKGICRRCIAYASIIIRRFFTRVSSLGEFLL